ncbi:hypothetical protein AKJ16_DCAP16449, partial [Drosera capensis]
GKRPPSAANDSDGNAAKKGRVTGGVKDQLMNRALGGISYGGRSSGRGRGRDWAGRSRGSGRGRGYWLKNWRNEKKIRSVDCRLQC